jgi:large subunit ribosomal protein L25
MSTEDFILNAEARDDAGKGASRRLRRLADRVPAIVYGGRKKPQPITVEHKELVKHLESEAFYSHIITLSIGDSNESVILKDVQRHPAKNKILHLDLLRVSKSTKLHTRVPLHFINEDICKGVKVGGGIIMHSMTDLEINCLPADLPEFVEVDLADVGIGEIVHISDLKLPKGVESVALALGADHDQPVAAVNKPKGTTADNAEDAAAEEGGEA